MQSERCVNSAHQAILSNLLLVMGLAIAVGFSFPSEAAEFSNTELQLQYGRLKVPKFAGGGEDNTTILTGRMGAYRRSHRRGVADRAPDRWGQ
jgi:hypothetical protein